MGQDRRVQTPGVWVRLATVIALILGSAHLMGGTAHAAPGASDYLTWGGYSSIGPPEVEQAPTGRRFVQISNGALHSLALDDLGHVWARGDNDAGQLGNGAVDPDARSDTWAPVTILPAAITVVDIEAPSAEGVWGFSLALDDTGQIWAWGSNAWGMLGDGGGDTAPTAPVTPVQVNLGPGIVATSISGGFGHALALDQYGRAWAWGLNASGELGTSSPSNRVLPKLVPGFTNLQQAEAGDQFSQLLDADGHVWGFGWNGPGSLGTTSGAQSWVPVQPDGLANVVIDEIAVGTQSTVALARNGKVWTWGSDTFHALGRGASPATTPDEVTFDDGTSTSSILAIDAGFHSGAAIDETGRLWGWGSYNGLTWPESAPPSPLLADVSGLAIDHVAVVSQGGRYGSALPAFFRDQTPPSPVYEGDAYPGYQFRAVALGDITYTLKSGSLPPGLALAANGALTGTPTAPGTYTFVVKAVDQVGAVVDSDAVSIQVNPAPIPPTLVDASPPNSGTVGSDYGPYTFTATGDPTINYAVHTGALPPGLTLAANGQLSGTPTSIGQYQFTVRATNTVGHDDTPTITITINAAPAPPTLVNESPPTSGSVANAYGPYTFTATGDPTINYAVHTGALPPGLTLAANGQLSGTPTSIGQYQFTVRATNTVGHDDTPTITITIDTAPASADLSVTMVQPTSVNQGDAWSTTANVVNNGPDGAGNVAVTMSIDARIELVALPAGCTAAGPSGGKVAVTCSVGALTTGAGTGVTISGRATPAGAGCTLYGTSGNDTLTGTGGADVICGLGGNDAIDGDGGRDTIYSDTPPSANAYAVASSASVTSATADPAAGNNTVSRSTSITLGIGRADYVTGGSGNDTIWGGEANDTLRGATGNDTMYGEAGSDSMSGAAGNDVITGTGGHDDLNGGDGADTLYGNEGKDTLIGSAGVDELYAGGGNDVLSGGSTIQPLLNLVNGGSGTDCASRGPDSRVSIEIVGVCTPVP